MRATAPSFAAWRQAVWQTKWKILPCHDRRRSIDGGLLGAGLVGCLAILACLSVSHAQPIDRVRDIVVQCAPCHGADGISSNPNIPNLTGQRPDYILRQLIDFRSGRRKHKDMRYLSRGLTEPELRAIADYYARIPIR